MSGLNPGFSSSNALDAGASSATKHADLTDGIHEDVSSDLKSKHQGSLFSSGSGTGANGGTQGGLLDSITGSTGALGYDAKHAGTLLQNTTGTGGGKVSGASDSASSAYESAKRGTANASSQAGQSLQELKDQAGSYAESARDKAAELGVSAQNAARDATQSNTGAFSSGTTTGTTTGTSGGLLETMKERVAGVFGGTTAQGRQESAFAAGASSAIKTTDLTDGIHEDAGKGIESVQGATARKH